MPSEYEVKFMTDMCGRRETGEKGGEKLRVYQVMLVAVQTFLRALVRESVTPSQSKPPAAATAMRGARNGNRGRS